MDSAQMTFWRQRNQPVGGTHRSGIPNLAVGLAGGYTGRRLRELLKARNVQEELIEIAGDTRINVKLRAGQETEINAPARLFHHRNCKNCWIGFIR